MIRLRVLMSGLVVSLVLIAVGAWLLVPHPGITRANAAKIQTGMARDEIERVLGGPARDERSSAVEIDRSAVDEETGNDNMRLAGMYTKMPQIAAMCRAAVWWADYVVVVVEFDEQLRAHRVVTVPILPPEKNMLLTICRWFGL